MDIEKAIYLRLKHSLHVYKSESYKNWLRKKFPNRELHHTLGSHTGYKTSDYFLLPLTREQHIEAENRKSEYAMENLPYCLNLLQEYLNELEGKML